MHCSMRVAKALASNEPSGKSKNYKHRIRKRVIDVEITGYRNASKI